MEGLKKNLMSADDEYLISLSNKGILKRACKDIESAKIKVSYIDGSAYVDIDGVQCVILDPLAESTCTCPSRSICRHIITAILWLKKELLSENETDKSEENNKQSAVKEKAEQLDRELREFPIEKLQKAMKKKYYNEYVRLLIIPKKITNLTFLWKNDKYRKIRK